MGQRLPSGRFPRGCSRAIQEPGPVLNTCRSSPGVTWWTQRRSTGPGRSTSHARIVNAVTRWPAREVSGSWPAWARIDRPFTLGNDESAASRTGFGAGLLSGKSAAFILDPTVSMRIYATLGNLRSIRANHCSPTELNFWLFYRDFVVGAVGLEPTAR